MAQPGLRGWSWTLLALSMLAAAHAGALAGETKPGEKPGGPPKEVSPAIINRMHHLGPGDLIEVTVDGYPQFGGTMTLFADGTIDLPRVGVVQAAGLTTDELAKRLEEAYRRALRRPRVRVALRAIYEKKPEPKIVPKITVLGMASRKGEIELPEPRPLRVVLALIGPAAEADLSQIRVRYPNGSAVTADFSEFDLTGKPAKPEHDVMIKGGEEIILLARPTVAKPDPIRVEVLGAVMSASSYVLEGQASILDVLKQAGGAKEDADLEHVRIEGPAHKTPRIVNAEDYRLGNLEAAYMVQQGDKIIVPRLPLVVYLYGAVAKPGPVAIRPNERLMEVVYRYGLGPTADVKKVEFYRRGPDGKPIKKVVNFQDIQVGKKPEGNEVLVASDVVFVPDKKAPKASLLDRIVGLASPLYMFRYLGL